MADLKSKSKRPFTLLEVLIAFLIIVLCVIPLISPHVTIYKDQLAFIERIELDHAVNELYGNIIEQLHRQQIPWETLTSDAKVHIDKNSLVTSGGMPLSYEGYYKFSITKKKPDKEEKPFTVYLFKLTFNLKSTLKSKSKDITYVYDIFLPRQLSGETPEPDENKDKKNDEKKDGKKEGEKK